MSNIPAITHVLYVCSPEIEMPYIAAGFTSAAAALDYRDACLAYFDTFNEFPRWSAIRNSGLGRNDIEVHRFERLFQVDPTP